MRRVVMMADWIHQLFWEIGWMVIQFAKGNIKGAIEMAYWIRTHLSHSGKCINKPKLSFAHALENALVEFVGVISVFVASYSVGAFITFIYDIAK